jgi:hypothetical protein
MDDFLMWPDMHTHKGKRQTEKQAPAITCDKYREMFEKKCLAKDAEEKEVQKKTRIIIIIIKFQAVSYGSTSGPTP